MLHLCRPDQLLAWAEQDIDEKGDVSKPPSQLREDTKAILHVRVVACTDHVEKAIEVGFAVLIAEDVIAQEESTRKRPDRFSHAPILPHPARSSYPRRTKDSREALILPGEATCHRMSPWAGLPRTR